MKDHAHYFDQHAEIIRTAGMLTEDMIGFYHDLFIYQHKQLDRYINDPCLPALQPSDLPIADQGKNIFSSNGVGELLAEGLQPLIDLLSSRNPGLDLTPLCRALAADPGALSLVAEAVLEMDAQRLEQFALSHKIGPEEAIFVMINWLKPFFISLREKHSALVTDSDDSLQCPFCGYQPDMAAIVSDKNGKRFLHCALCEHQWPYKRIACAVCGTEDADQLEYLEPENETRYRLDVCGACGGYIKTVRLDKFEDFDECDLTVVNILTPHLDSAAIKKGYKRP